LYIEHTKIIEKNKKITYTTRRERNLSSKNILYTDNNKGPMQTKDIVNQIIIHSETFLILTSLSEEGRIS